jgi:spore germination protein YaaH
MKEGYDGIHYDFEPIGDGDRHFLDLLDRTRLHTRLLSISTPQIEPYALMRLPARAIIGHDKYWSQEYFKQATARVEQVAIMTYDSFTPFPSLYGGYVVRQAELALDLVPDSKWIFIGAPAYHDQGLAWGDYAESVATTAQGAKLALTDHGKRDRFGLAMYVDFAATEEDWREYTTEWLS